MARKHRVFALLALCAVLVTIALRAPPLHPIVAAGPTEPAARLVRERAAVAPHDREGAAAREGASVANGQRGPGPERLPCTEYFVGVDCEVDLYNVPECVRACSWPTRAALQRAPRLADPCRLRARLDTASSALAGCRYLPARLPAPPSSPSEVDAMLWRRGTWRGVRALPAAEMSLQCRPGPRARRAPRLP